MPSYKKTSKKTLTNNTHRTKIQDKCLKEKDCNNNILSQWAQKIQNDEYNLYCWICEVNVNGDKGISKLQRHANVQKHKKNLYKLKNDQQQLIFQATNGNSSQASNQESSNSNQVTDSNSSHISNKKRWPWKCCDSS